MSLFRVRVQTEPPLPPSKSWYIIYDTVKTISDLKRAFCSDLTALRTSVLKQWDLALFLDEFELLATSRVADIVRDGELISVRMRSTLAKRKAADATSPPRKKAKLVHQRNAQISSSELSSSSSSSTSSSSSEESSTSSDSTSDSSSDSSSESDSDSSDSSTGSNVLNTHPTARPIRTAKSSGLDLRNTASSQCQLQVPSRKTVVLPSAPLVPPGRGKSSTHSRNIRRRRKKQFEREAASQPPVEVARSSVNATPLGVSAANSTPTSERTGSANENAQPSMMSLSNKNKRKGFKKAMASTTPQRIAFDDADATTLISALIPGKPASASRPASPSKQPRLIPPSEKQALGLLPPRMFVTSVDVEEGMWPHNMNGWDKKRKKKQRDTWGQDNGAEAEEEVHIELPYDDEDAAEPEGDVTATGAVDWDDVERRWDELAAVIPEQLASGTFIGWKEFGVHPVRLAPEMVVNIAKVTTVDASTSSVAVRTLSREASFGRVGPVMVDEEDLGEDVVHQVVNLGTLGWKVVAMY